MNAESLPVMRASDVADTGLWYVEATAARDLKPEIEVDILEIAEEPLVERTDANQPLSTVESGGAGSAEHLRPHGSGSRRGPVAPWPRSAVHVIHVAGGIEHPGLVGALDPTREGRVLEVVGGGRDQ